MFYLFACSVVNLYQKTKFPRVKGGEIMKYTELVQRQNYWCGWASRFARFEGIDGRTARFRDICNALVYCDVDSVEKWVITEEEYFKKKNL